MSGGHGHVVPRPDGVKARCGGPALCSVCAKELAAQQPVTAPTPGQAAYEAYVTFVGLPLSDWPWEADDVNQALWGAVASAVAGNLAAQEQPAPEPELPVTTPAVVRPRWGDVLILAVGKDFPADRARELQDLLAELNQGVTVTTVRGVDALRTWEPQPAPGPWAGSGFPALGTTADLDGDAPDEVRELTALRSGIAGLAADLDRSAAGTRPSRKSEIESETAIALRRLLETP